jgi:hypothetical protein
MKSAFDNEDSRAQAEPSAPPPAGAGRAGPRPKLYLRLFATAFVLLAVGTFFLSRTLVRRGAAEPVSIVLQGVTLSPIVSPRQVSSLGWDLSGKFDVTSAGVLLLQSKGRIYNVMSEQALLTHRDGELRDFTSVGGGIVAISGSWLCSFDNGQLTREVQLPTAEMSLASSSEPDSFYVYGAGDIYQFRSGGSYRKIVHADRPILALAGYNKRIFFSIWDKVVTWKPGEEQPSVILDAKLGMPITSLALDPQTGVLYFSAGEGVLALAEDEVVMVLAGVTGDLLFEGNLLLVKDQSQRSILAVSGASQAVKRQWTEMHARRGSPPPPVESPQAGVPQPQPPKPEFKGTRVGPFLASVFVLDDILVSHDAEVTVPPSQPPGLLAPTIPLAPKIVPRQNSVSIAVALYNDNDRALDLARDFSFKGDWLFSVTITDEKGNEVFEQKQELQGIHRWDGGEIRKFTISWPVVADMTGRYHVAVVFGFGGTLTAETRLR